jgi:hypothetical protein
VVGIKCDNWNIIDVSDNFRRSLKYKHGDLEKEYKTTQKEKQKSLVRRLFNCKK